MIDLDDAIWRELNHSYGSGEDIPAKLRRIESAGKLSAKFWDDLGNVLCHQCSVDTASYAAFPHLVRLADQYSKQQRGFESLKLAALILAFTIGPENKVPRMKGVLSKPFRQAIKDGRLLIQSMLFANDRDFTCTMQMLAIAGVFAGHADIFLLLGVLRNARFDCPECEELIGTDRLYTW